MNQTVCSGSITVMISTGRTEFVYSYCILLCTITHCSLATENERRIKNCKL